MHVLQTCNEMSHTYYVMLMQIFCLFLIHAYSTRAWKPKDAISTTTVAADTQARQDASNASSTASDPSANSGNSDFGIPATHARASQVPEGQTRLIMDGPWSLLWPCFLIWPINEAVLGFAWIHNAVGAGTCQLQCYLSLKSCMQCLHVHIWDQKHCLFCNPVKS